MSMCPVTTLNLWLCVRVITTEILIIEVVVEALESQCASTWW